MFGMVERLERIVVDRGDYYDVVDTCKTWDAGWETAIARVFKKTFAKEYWEDEYDFTAQDVADYCDESMLYWEVVQRYRTRNQAEKGHQKWGK